MQTLHYIGITMGIITFIVAIYIVVQYYQYRKVKKLYTSKDHRTSYLKSQVRKLYPLIPKPGSNRYNKVQKYINEAGWSISVEKIYVIKYISLLLVILTALGIKSTNMQMKIEDILSDLRFRKVAMDIVANVTNENVAREKELFEYFNTDISNNKDFYMQSNAPVYQGYISDKIKVKGWEIKGESPDITAKRLYYKLLAIRLMENDKTIYIVMLALATLVFYAPELMASLKFKLIVEKKYWEVINLCTVYSVFGSLPPYSLANVVDNMVMVADVFRNVVIMLRDGVKEAKGDSIYKKVLKQVDNEELYELIENMQLSNEVGLKNSVKSIDEIIENNLENIKVMNIYRRDKKNLYSMIPAYIVLTIAMLYAAYGIVPLANPFKAMELLNK